MKRIIALALMLVALNAMPAMASEVKDMKITCYCPESCSGRITASGAEVREGICAVTRDHLGDCALVWTEDGIFLGFFECLDVIGTGSPYVIDIWKPDLQSAKEVMAFTKGRVKVQFVEQPKG